MAVNSKKYLQATAYLMLAFIFVIVIGVARDCGRVNTIATEGHSRGDTLDIAMIFAPGSYYYYGDTVSGINQRIAEEFENATLTPIKIWAITEPEEGMTKLSNGTFDIIASLPLDNTIKKRFPISESIFLDRLVLVQAGDSSGNQSVNSSLDLNDRTVVVAAGSSAAQRMKNLANEIGGNINVVEEPEVSDELLTLQVANGTIPYAVVNERVAKEISKHYPNLKYDSSISFTQFQVWLFNPSDTISFKKFNNWFDGFRTSEKYRQIINSY